MADHPIIYPLIIADLHERATEKFATPPQPGHAIGRRCKICYPFDKIVDHRREAIASRLTCTFSPSSSIYNERHFQAGNIAKERMYGWFH